MFEQSLVESRTAGGTWHTMYHTYDEIVGWYKDIADSFESITKLVPSIGQCHEGRDMPVSPLLLPAVTATDRCHPSLPSLLVSIW